MIRSVWLALIFLFLIGALAAFKVSFAAQSKQQAALSDGVVGQGVDRDAPALEVLAKGDRLDEIPDKKVVQAIAIGSPVAAQPAGNRIISRHWQDSHATMKFRNHHRHHESRNRHRRVHG